MRKNKFDFLRKFVVVVLCVTLLFTCLNALASEEKIDKLVFITDTQGMSDISEFDLERDKNDWSVYMNYEDENFDLDNVLQYRAVAFPYCNYLSNEIREAYNSGCIVYLYGELTIQDYKNAVGLSDFTLEIELYNEDGNSSKKVTQSFDLSYEASETFNIISYSENALLNKVLGDIFEGGSQKTARNYLVPIEKNFSELKRLNTRSTIIQSKYDIETTFGADSQYSVVMDYQLYRNYEEEDPEYDYFGIITRVWVDHAEGNLHSLQTKYELPFSVDNLLETGPESKGNIGQSLEISVGYGDGKLSGSIGYTLDLGDTRPKIVREEDFSNDTVEWTMSRRLLFPKSINGNNLKCCATWASKGSALAAIDVYFNGTIVVTINEYQMSPGNTRIPIRFSY